MRLPFTYIIRTCTGTNSILYRNPHQYKPRHKVQAMTQMAFERTPPETGQQLRFENSTTYRTVLFRAGLGK
jgi:hypothetical protein